MPYPVSHISGVYRIVHTDSNKCYVGSAYDIRTRWRKHRNKLASPTDQHHSRHLQSAWNKYGPDAFSWEILEEIERIPDMIAMRTLLLEREQYYIDTLKPAYNINPLAGSALGVKRSEETRRKVAAAGTGRTRSAESRKKQSESNKGHPAWNKGIPHTPEALAKISAALKGKKRPNTSATLKGHRGWNKGMIVSTETREKLSLAGKGRAKSPEHRAKIGASQVGKSCPHNRDPEKIAKCQATFARKRQEKQIAKQLRQMPRYKIEQGTLFD